MTLREDIGRTIDCLIGDAGPGDEADALRELHKYLVEKNDVQLPSTAHGFISEVLVYEDPRGVLRHTVRLSTALSQELTLTWSPWLPHHRFPAEAETKHNPEIDRSKAEVRGGSKFAGPRFVCTHRREDAALFEDTLAEMAEVLQLPQITSCVERDFPTKFHSFKEAEGADLGADTSAWLVTGGAVRTLVWGQCSVRVPRGIMWVTGKGSHAHSMRSEDTTAFTAVCGFVESMRKEFPFFPSRANELNLADLGATATPRKKKQRFISFGAGGPMGISSANPHKLDIATRQADYLKDKALRVGRYLQKAPPNKQKFFPPFCEWLLGWTSWELRP